MAGKQQNLEARAQKAMSASKSRTKGAPRSKRGGANNGPSRQRYWATRRLEQHKVKALMAHSGMTRAQALVFWQDARGGRRMK